MFEKGHKKSEMTPFKAEIQLYLELIVATKGEYVSISMNLNNWKKYTNGTDCDFNKECGNSNSFLLQVFIYKNEHIAEWKELKKNDDFDGKKKLSADGKWGMVHIIIPEKNCDIIEIDSLSSTDVVNEYRQLLLQDRDITLLWCHDVANVQFRYDDRHSY